MFIVFGSDPNQSVGYSDNLNKKTVSLQSHKADQETGYYPSCKYCVGGILISISVSGEPEHNSHQKSLSCLSAVSQ